MGSKSRVFVVMGVSASGKTTIGTLLAKRLNGIFADADDYHSAQNKAKMAAGTPLTDEDRAPWLASLHDLLQQWVTNGTYGVLACSALKESYRSVLGAGFPEGVPAFIWLDLPKAVLAARMAARQHSFMNPALLDSQLATLEAPTDALRVMNDRTPEAVVDEIMARLNETPA